MRQGACRAGALKDQILLPEPRAGWPAVEDGRLQRREAKAAGSGAPSGPGPRPSGRSKGELHLHPAPNGPGANEEDGLRKALLHVRTVTGHGEVIKFVWKTG